MSPSNISDIGISRWYVDVALAVGLQLTTAERLRFFVASDSAEAIADFAACVTATLARDFPGSMRGNSSSSSVVFHASGDQDTRGAALDMLLLGMTDEMGKSLCTRKPVL